MYNTSPERHLVQVALVLALLVIAITSATLAIKGPAVPSPSAITITDRSYLCEEDQPCWDCLSMGNGICGPMSPEDHAQGWAVLDASGGATALDIDTTRAFRMEFVGTALEPVALTPDQFAITGDDGREYIFRVVYIGLVV